MRPWSLGLVTAILAASLAGCGDGAVPEQVTGTRCLPQLPTLRPAAVAAGAELTITSTGFTCGTRYDEGKQYALELSSVGRTDPIDLGDVDVAPDGSFSVTVTVPVEASPGESALVVAGSPYDEPCDDTNGSCAGYGTSLTVLPAS
jgi:hypothetical protein